MREEHLTFSKPCDFTCASLCVCEHRVRGIEWQWELKVILDAKSDYSWCLRERIKGLRCLGGMPPVLKSALFSQK